MFRKLWIPASLYQLTITQCQHSLARRFRIHAWAKAYIKTTAWPCIWCCSPTNCCTWIRTTLRVISSTKYCLGFGYDPTGLAGSGDWLTCPSYPSSVQSCLSCSHHCWTNAKSTNIPPSAHITTWFISQTSSALSTADLPNPPWLPKPPGSPPHLPLLSVATRQQFNFGYMYADSFNGHVLFTERLGNLIIHKRNKGKSPEQHGIEDIYHFPVLAKELPQLISSHVLCTAPSKYLTASQRLLWALIRIWKFTVTLLSIYHMLLWCDFHLGFIFCKMNKVKSFQMTSF